VEWSWWSGVAILGVECSQTGPKLWFCCCCRAK
jgi:hypothetical protein